MIKWLVILQVLFHCTLSAQSDTINPIDVVKITGPEINIEGILSTSTLLTPKSSANNISDLLSYHKGIHIQTQGGPYLRTALYRGQSARHMAILWEGVNIQNSFNGTYDLGLISSSLFDDSKWYDGGHSANIGTAAMSGALVLDETFKNKPNISAGIRYNDQNNRLLHFGIYHEGSVSHIFQLGLINNENDFRYAERDVIKKRKNANHDQFDLSYKASVNWSDAMRSHMSYWYQDVDRKLPPSTISTTIAHQKDQNHRLSFGHDWQLTPHSYWSTKLAYMNEYLEFKQPGIESIARSEIVNINTKWKIDGPIDHTIGMAFRYENGELADSINPLFESFFPERNIFAIHYNGIIKKGKTSLSLSLRQESIDNNLQTPTGKLSFKYDHSKSLSYTINLGRHYSYPGFNDLYWPTGGNIDLTSEKSWQIECGFSFHNLSVKIYQIYTRDKILWAPNEQNIWTPENLSTTNSTGFEIEYESRIGWTKNLELSFKPLVNYNHTVNTAEGVNKGNELLYNPKLNFQLNTQIDYHQMILSITDSFRGRRFQSLDNISELDGYNLLDIECGYNWSFNKKYKAYIYISIQNILDHEYELVRFYPQPLRSFYFGANFSIQ